MKAVTLKKYFSLSIFMIVLGMNVNVLACNGWTQCPNEHQLLRADHNCDLDRNIRQYIAIQALGAETLGEGKK